MLDKVINLLVNLHLKQHGGKVASETFYTNLLRKSLEGLNFGESDMFINGENANLERLIANNPNDKLVMFDIGANVGDYSLEIIKKCGSRPLELHCFEPSKQHFKLLNENVKHDNVTFNNFGLSDKDGTLTLFKDKDVSGLASLYQRDIEYHNIYMDKTEEVELRTFDGYCNEKGIKRVDFVKMDVEGHEYNVLLGATESLKNGVIKSLQLEFGGCNIASKVFFRDLYKIFTQNNYTIYRIAKDGVCPVTKYAEHQEMFVYCNYFMVYNG